MAEEKPFRKKVKEIVKIPAGKAEYEYKKHVVGKDAEYTLETEEIEFACC